jgi:hypothetical protein
MTYKPKKKDRKAKSEIKEFLDIIKSINDLHSKLSTTEKKKYTKEGDIENIFRQINPPHRAIYKACGEMSRKIIAEEDQKHSEKCKYKYCPNKARKGNYFCSNDCAILKLALIIVGLN